MKYTTVANPQWADAAHTAIIAAVTFEKHGVLPFGASASDVEAHGREIFNRAVAGDFGPIAAYVAPTKTPRQLKREAEQGELDAAKQLPLVKQLRRMSRADVLAAVDEAFPAGLQRDLIRQLAVVAWAGAVERDRNDD